LVAVHYVMSVALACQYLHERKIIHRDIKPSNIFLASDWTVQLCDFGDCRQLSDASSLASTCGRGVPAAVAAEAQDDLEDGADADGAGEDGEAEPQDDLEDGADADGAGEDGEAEADVSVGLVFAVVGEPMDSPSSRTAEGGGLPFGKVRLPAEAGHAGRRTAETFMDKGACGASPGRVTWQGREERSLPQMLDFGGAGRAGLLRVAVGAAQVASLGQSGLQPPALFPGVRGSGPAYRWLWEGGTSVSLRAADVRQDVRSTGTP
jgi:serine/threonine protein kinase